MKERSMKVRWGIVGAGKIAGKFAEDLALSKGAELVAVGSTSLSRAKDFAAMHEVPKAFGSYQELFECPEVDVVYVANVHTQHAETSIQAMNNGKHVLCEKPAGINAREVAAMIEASRQNRVFFMEALWSRFNPTLRKIKELIDGGSLGDLRYVHADFCFYALDRDIEKRLLNPALGGGSLLDIGIYPVFLSYLLMGVPDNIHARSKFFHTGAEIQTSMIFDYPNGQAVLHSSLANNAKMEARITGERGEIYIAPRWHEATGFTLVKNGEEEKVELPVTGRGYFYEIEEVNDVISRGLTESALWSHQDALALIRLLDEIRKKSDINYAADPGA